MGQSWQCGSCRAVVDFAPPPGEPCPSCGSPPVEVRLQRRVAVALCCGSVAFLFASVPGLAVTTKPLAVVAAAVGISAFLQARRADQPWGKPAGVTLLGLGVLLFLGSWQDVRELVGAGPPPPNPTRQTVMPLRPPAGQPPAASKDVKEADPEGWVDASQGAIRQDGIRVQIGSVRLGHVRFKNRAANDPLTRANRLLVEIRVANGSPTRTGHFDSWYAPVADTAKPGARLTDNSGRSYKPAAFGAGVEVMGVARPSPLTSGRVVRDLVVFDCPSLEGVQTLNLELPGAAVGGQGTFKFRIPRAMIQTGGPKGKAP